MLTAIQEMTHQRRTIHAAKATGVSLRRDILAMEDAGAARSLVFTDLGAVTTTPCADVQFALVPEHDRAGSPSR